MFVLHTLPCSAALILGQAPGQPTTVKEPAPAPAPNPLLPQPPPPPPSPQRDSKSDMARFRSWRQWNKTLGNTGDNDHEDAGVMITPKAQNVYSGIYAKHIVYRQGEIQLSLPSNAAREQILYAATTRPPNGSCLEVGTAYTTQPVADPASARTVPVLYVYDFCAPGGGNFAPGLSPDSGKLIDEEFIKKYAQTTVQGISAYEIEIFARDANPISSKSVWHAQIFNHQTGKWELLYSDRGVSDDNQGWSIFETYYQKGRCSESLPILGVDQVALYNTIRARWELLNPDLPLVNLKIDQGGVHNRECFVPDIADPATYELLPSPPVYYSWTVKTQGGR